MAAEGKPTGIKRDDVNTLSKAVGFEGGRASLWRQSTNGDGRVRLELETFSGQRLALYGYYVRGGEFIEVEREHLD